MIIKACLAFIYVQKAAPTNLSLYNNATYNCKNNLPRSLPVLWRGYHTDIELTPYPTTEVTSWLRSVCVEVRPN